MADAPASHPCGSCPYRQDVPSGVWDPSEYDKLPAYDRDTMGQPPSLFLCHQQNGKVCAGWAGCHDMNHSLAMRFAVLQGNLTPEDAEAVFDYESPVPLWSSGAEAREHGLADVDEPGEQAAKVIGKLERRRDRG